MHADKTLSPQPKRSSTLAGQQADGRGGLTSESLAASPRQIAQREMIEATFGGSRGPQTPAQRLSQPSRPVVQRVFTVRGEDAGRVVHERVDAYLEQHAPGLAGDFKAMSIDLGSGYGELADWLEGNGLPRSLVGDANEPESVMVESMSQIMNEVISKLGVSEVKVLEMLVDLDVAGDLRQAEKVAGVREYKKQFPLMLQEGWQYWTSCFDTSLRLFNLLCRVPIMSMTTAGGNAGALVHTMRRLCDQMHSLGQERMGGVFRVNLGDADHSFVVVVQGQFCEFLQSFAGPSGESLLKNVSGPHVYSLEAGCTHLMNVCQTKAEREASSVELFGGEILLGGTDHSVDLWPTLPISWQMGGLHLAQECFRLLSDKIRGNLDAIKKLTGK
jgi:hypothetical protein